jgi:acid stress-induced BolA-like protein IbaG/YrbA
MIYTQLSPGYKFEVIAEAVYGRELEHFHYDFDRRNVERLIAGLPDGDYKDSIAQRLADTLKQMANVDAIYAALMAQVDDPAAYAEAVKTVTKKREDAKNEVRAGSK